MQRCLDALNGFDSATLEDAQTANLRARHRNVGLVIETRPDRVTLREIARLRSLGVTKVQVGAQSLDDHLLALNKRGHTVEVTRRAVGLLRAAGFKIVLHWMPNLLGATPESDRADFARLWEDPGLRPDELKIYPCVLLADTELHARWQRGEYEPYTTDQLIQLIADLKAAIPRYCRVNRVVRDIPSGHVLAGNKRTSLRMDVQHELERRGQACNCIRCREVRGQDVDPQSLKADDLVYAAGGTEEHFLSYSTPDARLAGYLRLSLPGEGAPATGLPDLDGAALVREVHIVGQSLELGRGEAGVAQHAGLGSRLMAEAEDIARQHGSSRVAVIAALGVRDYYRRLGYRLAETYMVKDI
jgi:elongator complex protein 3